MDNNYKKIKAVFYIVLTISIVVSLWGKIARASEMDSKDVTYLESNYFANCDNRNDADSYLRFIYQNFPYYVISKSDVINCTHISLYSHPGIYVAHWNDSIDNGIPTSFSSWGTYGVSTDRLTIIGFNGANITLNGLIDNTFSINNYTTDIMEVEILIYEYQNIKSMHIGFNCAYDSDVGTRSVIFYNFDTGFGQYTEICDYNTFSNSRCRQLVLQSSFGESAIDYLPLNNSFNIWTSAVSNYFSEIETNYNSYLFNANNTTYTVFPYESNIEYPADTNTSGFDVYTYGTDNNERLVCDFTECISISQAVANSSNIEITLNVDGTTEVRRFDSTSEYYSYSNSGNVNARYSFPTELFIPADSSYVIIEKIKVENTTTSPGGSEIKNIFWVSPIYLKGSDYQDVEMGEADFDSDYPPISNEQIAENTYLVEFTSIQGANNFDFRQVTLPDQYDKDCAFVYFYAGSASLNDFLTLLGPDFEFVKDIVGYFQGYDTIEECETKIEEYLWDNAFTCTRSAILFIWVNQTTTTVVNPENCTYWFYPTIVGRINATNYILNDTYTDISRQLDIMSGLSNYLKSRLDDFEEKSLTKLNQITGLSDSIFKRLIKMNNVLNLILDSLLDLELEQLDTINTTLSTNFDSILSKLDSMTPHNEIDTVEECIKYYNENQDSNGFPTINVYTEDRFSVWFTGKVHSWSNNSDTFLKNERSVLMVHIFNILSSGYDEFMSHNTLNYINEYLGYLTGDHTQNSRNEFMTHFFDGTFNIDSYNGI